MKYLIIPGLPIAAIAAQDWLATHLPSSPACIAAAIIAAATTYTCLALVHRLVFGHYPRFFPDKP